MYKPTPSPAVGIDIFNKSEFHPLKYFFDISNFIQLDWIVRKMSASTAKGLYLQREKNSDLSLNKVQPFLIISDLNWRQPEEYWHHWKCETIQK